MLCLPTFRLPTYSFPVENGDLQGTFSYFVQVSAHLSSWRQAPQPSGGGHSPPPSIPPLCGVLLQHTSLLTIIHLIGHCLPFPNCLKSPREQGFACFLLCSRTVSATWGAFSKYMWDRMSDHGGNVHVSLGQGPADYLPGRFVTTVSSIPGLQVGVVDHSLGLVYQGLSKGILSISCQNLF